MDLHLNEIINRRMEELEQNLLKTNGVYAQSAEKNSYLIENVESILKCTHSITLSVGDFMDIAGYIDEENTQADILQKAAYRQGCIDCVKLLRTMGVLY